VQHIEFFHRDHFENNYHRVPPPPGLELFIDFFWETRFDPLWSQYPKGFSDAQFPNIGYTYIINIGTPFVMQVSDEKFNMKTHCLLPRYNAIECFHKPGNHLFGIKFRISPILFEKKVNFAEYRAFLFPLSYLLDEKITSGTQKAPTFEKRVALLSAHFSSVLQKHKGDLQPAGIVSKILNDCDRQNDFSVSVAQLADDNRISARTLQRYFETCTGISCKKALLIMRIRKATSRLLESPGEFHYSHFGYYDHSHFYKHLRQFVSNNTLQNMKPHLDLLRLLHK